MVAFLLGLFMTTFAQESESMLHTITSEFLPAQVTKLVGSGRDQDRDAIVVFDGVRDVTIWLTTAGDCCACPPTFHRRTRELGVVVANRLPMERLGFHTTFIEVTRDAFAAFGFTVMTGTTWSSFCGVSDKNKLSKLHSSIPRLLTIETSFPLSSTATLDTDLSWVSAVLNGALLLISLFFCLREEKSSEKRLFHL